MPAFGFVKHLDVVEHVTTRRIPGQVDLSPDLLSLEQLEEALGHGVVVAIAAPAHAADDPMSLQERLPLCAGELTALVRVQHQAGCRFSMPYRCQWRL